MFETVEDSCVLQVVFETSWLCPDVRNDAEAMAFTQLVYRLTVALGNGPDLVFGEKVIQQKNVLCAQIQACFQCCLGNSWKAIFPVSVIIGGHHPAEHCRYEDIDVVEAEIAAANAGVRAGEICLRAKPIHAEHEGSGLIKENDVEWVDEQLGLPWRIGVMNRCNRPST